MTLTQYKERWEELIVVTCHAVVLHVFDDHMYLIWGMSTTVVTYSCLDKGRQFNLPGYCWTLFIRKDFIFA